MEAGKDAISLGAIKEPEQHCILQGPWRRTACEELGCTKSAEGKTDYCIAHGGGQNILIVLKLHGCCASLHDALVIIGATVTWGKEAGCAVPEGRVHGGATVTLGGSFRNANIDKL
ncbi:hypothetical protein ZWY2020_040702 [Hordeum vulgare]|nr:hypothetical protein ZWY2020_040702 [Hordeum vulgare]